MDVTPGKGEQAREFADEFLGRGAGVARAAVGPLGFLGKVVLSAGLIIWVAGPAPFWDNAPSIAFAVLALIVLAAPGLRMLRHRGRMFAVLNDLPALLDNLDGALDATSGVAGLPGRWRDRRSPATKPGLAATAKRCYAFYREDLAPLRSDVKIIDQVTDALAAFNGGALFLTGLALIFGLIEVVLAPVAVLVRLFN